MIRLQNVSVGHTKGDPILDDVSIDLPSDRRVAILGRQGSGKTTLLSLLAGVIDPWQGRVERGARLSFPAGYQRGFRLANSARQNIMFAAMVYGADADEVYGFVSEVTEFGGALNAPMRDLSAAERIVVSYALTYAIPFDTYLFDNAIAQGTPQFRERCLTMFEERTRSCGAFVATRVPRIATLHCDCAVLIRDRGLEFFEDLAEALRQFAQDNALAADADLGVAAE